MFGPRAFISGRWKALWMPEPHGSGERELHDLDRDPTELEDLQSVHPRKLEDLVERWQAYERENGVRFPLAGGTH